VVVFPLELAGALERLVGAFQVIQQGAGAGLDHGLGDGELEVPDAFGKGGLGDGDKLVLVNAQVQVFGEKFDDVHGASHYLRYRGQGTAATPSHHRQLAEKSSIRSQSTHTNHHL
jgi:hypothetical protein